MSRASTTSRPVIVAPIDQPTIMQLNRSSTTAGYSQPSAVGMYVMSADQARFGPGGAKSRSRTLAATGRPCRESVVRTNERGALARMPSSFMSAATAFSEQSCPRAFSSAILLSAFLTARVSIGYSSIRVGTLSGDEKWDETFRSFAAEIVPGSGRGRRSCGRVGNGVRMPPAGHINQLGGSSSSFGPGTEERVSRGGSSERR
jgi:hypothetical protein